VRLVPADVAVSSASARTNEFKIDVSYQYIVELRFQSSHPDPVVECLLDMRTYSSPCANRESVLQFKWQLYGENRLLKEGAVNRPSCFESGEFHCVVGSFEGTKGQLYIAQIQVGKQSALLHWTNPRLVIVPQREFSDDWGATYFFVEPLAVASAAAGVWLIASGLFVWTKHKGNRLAP
jgi:hypothetical protein